MEFDKQALRELFGVPEEQYAIVVVTHIVDSENVGSWGPFSVRQNAEACVIKLSERADIERAIIVVLEPVE